MDYLGLVSTRTMVSGKVSSKMGDNYGSVKELIVDPATGKVVLVVVSAGGLLGMGETDKVLPWEALQMNPNTHDFQLIIDREAFHDSPELREEDYADRVVMKKFFDYFGFQPYWENNKVENSMDYTYRNTEQNQHHGNQEFEGSHQIGHDTLSHNDNNQLGEEADFNKIRGIRSSSAGESGL